MTPDSPFSLLSTVLDAAARSLAFALAAGLGFAVLRVKAASARLAVWRAVLYAALAMPLLAALLPAVKIPLPATPAARILASRATFKIERAPALPRSESSGGPALRRSESSGGLAANEYDSRVATKAPAIAAAADSTEPQPKIRFTWMALAAGVYLLVAALLLAHFVLGIVLSRRLLSHAEPIRDAKNGGTLCALVEAAREAAVPCPLLASSPAVIVPVTVGLLRPAILLPADWSAWEEPRLRAVLAHELSHVARRDPLTQAVAAIHRSLYWFSPLGWWLERHLSELAELASDEAALRSVPDRRTYAEILLGFMRTFEERAGRVRWQALRRTVEGQGAAMARGARSRRRIERILSADGLSTARIGKVAAACLVFFAAPALYFAAAIQSGTTEQAPPPAVAPAKPSEPPKPAAAPRGAPAVRGPVAPAALFHLPAAPVAPAALRTQVAAQALRRSAAAVRTVLATGPQGSLRLALLAGKGSIATFSGDFDEDQAFVIVSGDSTTMSGSSEDSDHAKSLRAKIKGDFIWFRRDDKGYVIRDQATVKQAKEIFAPQEALGREQEELGKQQEDLGAQQERLGKKESEVSVEIPDLTADLKKIEAQLSDKKMQWTPERLAEVQSELAELQAKLGEQQERAGAEQGRLGAEQGLLGAKQAVLGAKQERLGHEQELAAREANEKMKKLFDDALSSGRAEPEPK